jgi:hypothetical protein
VRAFAARSTSPSAAMGVVSYYVLAADSSP